MQKQKTVAIVINTSWNIYNFRLGLLKALKNDGYRIITIAPEDEYSKTLRANGFDYHNIKINNKGTKPIEDLNLMWSFYKLYTKFKPDVILHYTIKPNIYGSLAAKLAGIPSISNVSGLGTIFLNEGLSSKIAKYLYKFSFRFPVKVFFQNKDDKNLFLKSKLVKQDKVDLLPGSGIDTNKFIPVVKETEHRHLSFLFIGRLVKDKGLVEYVDAARLLKLKYPAVSFNILGAFYPGNPTAITPETMDKWVEEEVVCYLGTSKEVSKNIADTACVVLPSYREGLSRVLLEAASMAKPIVTTDVPGCRDVVDSSNGLLCKAKNVKSLADQMEVMISLSPEKRAQMGLNGRAKVIREFDESIVINKYQNAIREALS